MQMSFKIVQLTKATGKLELAAVPSAWESNGTLKWPSKMSRNKISQILHDASSVPGDGKEWISYVCTVKRLNMATYTEALNELADMELNSDSDLDSLKMPPPQPSACKRLARRCTATVAKTNADDLRNDFNRQVCTRRQYIF